MANVEKISDEVLNNMIKFVLNGNTKISQQFVSQSTIIDEQFITHIDELLFSVENIAKSPKRFIKNNQLIVNVERAKHIDSESVRHLASHTEYIRSVEPDGTVMPSKILSNEFEEDIAIYENRFVFSLINFLSQFIEKRYGLICENASNKDITTLSLSSKFSVGKADVFTNLDMKLSVPSKNENLIDKNQQLIETLEKIRTRILAIKGSEFYQSLKNAKPVLPPIQKTNIILMHKDYKAAYSLWLYLASYTSMGYSLTVKQKDIKIEDDYYQALARIIGETAQALIKNDSVHANFYNDAEILEKTKKFNIIRATDFEPTFSLSGSESKENLLNQFYYDKVKEIVYKKINKFDLPEVKEQIDDHEKKENIDYKKLDITFGKFFRNLSSINNTMMTELLYKDLQKPEKTKKDDKVGEIKEQMKVQTQLLKRMKIMSKLKSQELEKMLKKETLAVVKFEKLKYNLADAEGVLERKR